MPPEAFTSGGFSGNRKISGPAADGKNGPVLRKAAPAGGTIRRGAENRRFLFGEERTGRSMARRVLSLENPRDVGFSYDSIRRRIRTEKALSGGSRLRHGGARFRGNRTQAGFYTEVRKAYAPEKPRMKDHRGCAEEKRRSEKERMESKCFSMDLAGRKLTLEFGRYC